MSEQSKPLTSEEVKNFLTKISEGSEINVLNLEKPDLSTTNKDEKELSNLENLDLSHVKRVEISNEMVSTWISSIQNEQNLASLQKLYLCFYVITRPRKQTYDVPYHISSKSLQLKIILLNLKYSHLIFTKHEASYPSNSERQMYIGSLMKSLIFFFENDRLTYRVFSNELPHILSFLFPLLPIFLRNDDGKLTQYLIYEILHFLKHPNKKVRNQSFLILLKIATTKVEVNDVAPPPGAPVPRISMKNETPFLDYILKGVYFLFLNRLNYYSPKNFTVIQFLKSSLLELYKLSTSRSYNHVFLFLQELGKSLRNAMSDSSRFKYIYSWKYYHSLDLFSKIILSSKAREVKKKKKRKKGKNTSSSESENLIIVKDNPMDELLLPLITIIIGVIRLKSESMLYIPLRFKYVEILHRIQQTRGIYVPSVYFITELFKNDSFLVSQRGMCKKNIEFEFLLRIPVNEEKTVLRTKEFQKLCFDYSYYYILEFCWIHRRSVSFPEMIFPLHRILRHLYRRDKRDISHYFKFKLKSLVKIITEEIKFVTEQRKRIKFAEFDNKNRRKRWRKEEGQQQSFGNKKPNFIEIDESSHVQTSLEKVFQQLKKERLEQRVQNLSQYISEEDKRERPRQQQQQQKGKFSKKRKRDQRKGKKSFYDDEDEEEDEDEDEEEDEDKKGPVKKKRKLEDSNKLLFVGEEDNLRLLNSDGTDDPQKHDSSTRRRRRKKKGKGTKKVGDEVSTMNIEEFFD